MSRVIKFKELPDHMTAMQRECDQRAAELNATCDAWDKLGRWVLPALHAAVAVSVLAVALQGIPLGLPQ